MVDIPSLIHLGLDLARQNAGGMRVTVRQVPVIGRTRTGIQYGAPVDVDVIAEWTTKTVIGSDGTTTVTSAKLSFMEPWPVTDDDKFILPGSDEQIPVLKVDGLLDPTTGAPYAPVVWL